MIKRSAVIVTLFAMTLIAASIMSHPVRAVTHEADAVQSLEASSPTPTINNVAFSNPRIGVNPVSLLAIILTSLAIALVAKNEISRQNPVALT